MKKRPLPLQEVALLISGTRDFAPPLPGSEEEEEVERLQKDDLRRSSVTIIGADQESNSRKEES